MGHRGFATPGSVLLTPSRQAELRLWLLLAVGALAVAGALALMLALSRTPKIQDWLPWSSDFFHKGLVTHVVFSVVVWFLAMLGALTAATRPGSDIWGRAGLFLAMAGSLLLLVTTLAGWGEASLNNYVPVLDHPFYYAGLALLGFGIALASAPSLRHLRLQAPGFEFGIAIGALGVFSALACFGLAWALIPAGTDRPFFNERLFWGGGHVLQFVNTILMMASWHALAVTGFGRPALPPAAARAIFAALGLFILAAPLLYGLDVQGLAHRVAFTQLLWYGLALPPFVMGLGVAWLLAAKRGTAHPTAKLALFLSLAVFGLGGVAGFFLGAGDTRTPSHYHAVIGGVNLALMAMIHVHLLPAIGRAAASRRMVHPQLWLYGGGQLLHAAGFYVAGMAGIARKTAGAEQGLDSAAKLISMGIVGLGGAIAVLGGVLFVVQVLALLLRKDTRHA